ncbi:hypothetical protein ACWXVJ_03060 [Mycoplasma sp. 773]
MSRISNYLLNEQEKIQGNWTKKEIENDNRRFAFENICNSKKYLKLSFSAFLSLTRKIKLSIKLSTIQILRKKQNASLVYILILLLKKKKKISSFKLSDLRGYGITEERLRHALKELKKLNLIYLKGKFYSLNQNALISPNKKNVEVFYKIETEADWMLFFAGNFSALIAAKKLKNLIYKKKYQKEFVITNNFLNLTKAKIKKALFLICKYLKLYFYEAIKIKKMYLKEKSSFITTRYFKI